MKKAELIITLLLFFLVIFQLTYKIGNEQIKIWDESSGAKNAVEMLQNGNYLMAYNNGVPDHKDLKPPFQLWLKVISFKLFGINEFAVRFPSLVAAILTAILFFLFALLFLKNIKISFILLVMISISSGYIGYHVARNGDPDALLTFFVSIYFLIFFIILEKLPSLKPLNFILLGLSIMFAVFTKGIAGVAPLIGMAVYFFTQKKHFFLLRSIQFHLTWIGVIVFILSYYLIREIYDPGFLQAVYQSNFVVLLDYPGIPKHPEFLFYFDFLVKSGFYPFMYFLPLFVIPLIWSKNKLIKRLIIYSLLSSTFFLLGQSSAVMKNEWYIAPIYPFLWILLSVSLVETYTIIKSLISRKIVFRIMQVVLVVSVLFFYKNRFIEVIEKNNVDNGFIYERERAGDFLDDVKSKFPEIKDITIINKLHPRQLYFYIKKYEYTDSTKFVLKKYVDKDMLHQYVLTTDETAMEKLSELYSFDVLYKGKYGVFMYIEAENQIRINGR